MKPDYAPVNSPDEDEEEYPRVHDDRRPAPFLPSHGAPPTAADPTPSTSRRSGSRNEEDLSLAVEAPRDEAKTTGDYAPVVLSRHLSAPAPGSPSASSYPPVESPSA